MLPCCVPICSPVSYTSCAAANIVVRGDSSAAWLLKLLLCRWLAFTNPAELSPVSAVMIFALFTLGMGINVSADSFKNASKLAGAQQPCSAACGERECERERERESVCACVSPVLILFDLCLTPSALLPGSASVVRAAHPGMHAGASSYTKEVWDGRLTLRLPGRVTIYPNHLGDWMRYSSLCEHTEVHSLCAC